MKTALLVVDLQKCFLWENDISSIKDDVRRRVATNITEEIQRARTSSVPMIFIVYGYSWEEAQKYQLNGPCEACYKNTGMVEFLSHRHEENFEPVFFKRMDNAFANENLAPYLRGLGISHIVLVGCNTGACILQTAKGAVAAGFDVTLLANCTCDNFGSVLKSQGECDEWVRKVGSSPKRQVQVANAP